MIQLARKRILPLIRHALREDGASKDLTSRSVLPSDARVTARIVAKAPGILAGGPVALWTFQTVEPTLRCALKAQEGAQLKKGQTILMVSGRARSIFAAERVALNILGHLSGIATLTHEFVRRVRPFRAKIFDTRKTLPGLRLLEKYAVAVGGGRNHRFGLPDAVLIKTSHLRAAYRVERRAERTGIQAAIKRARRKARRKFVEVEVTNHLEFEAALRAQPDAILLDNWTVSQVRKAVALLHATRSTLNASLLLEVSGGVTLDNVRAIAKTGVDRISIGRLTHSAPSLDLSLLVTSDGG